jgi:ParB family chromosome partitioning protein
MGHARALLSLASAEEQLRLRDQILAHSWSVRATEEGVVRKRSKVSLRSPRRRAPEMTALEDSIRAALATRVRLVGTERAGRIEVMYSSREELDRLVDLLVGPQG